MAKKGSGSGNSKKGKQGDSTVVKVKRWFSHRHLIALEVLLGLDLILRVTKTLLMESQAVPNWGKIIIIMALTIGFLGFIMMWLTRIMAVGLEGAHRTISAIPVLRHHLIIHCGIFTGFFFLYALIYGVLDNLMGYTA